MLSLCYTLPPQLNQLDFNNTQYNIEQFYILFIMFFLFRFNLIIYSFEIDFEKKNLKLFT